jgi:hypothetical protein
LLEGDSGILMRYRKSKDNQVHERARKTGTMAGMLTENAIVALNNGDVDLRPILQVSVSVRVIHKVQFRCKWRLPSMLKHPPNMPVCYV